MKNKLFGLLLVIMFIVLDISAQNLPTTQVGSQWSMNNLRSKFFFVKTLPSGAINYRYETAYEVCPMIVEVFVLNNIIIGESKAILSVKTLKSDALVTVYYQTLKKNLINTSYLSKIDESTTFEETYIYDKFTAKIDYQIDLDGGESLYMTTYNVFLNDI